MAKQPPQQKKGPKNQKIKPPNPRKALFPRILAVFHCINFVVAMFPYACGYFPNKRLKFLSLFFAPKGLLRFLIPYFYKCTEASTEFDDGLWLTAVEKATSFHNGRLFFIFQSKITLAIKSWHLIGFRI